MKGFPLTALSLTFLFLEYTSHYVPCWRAILEDRKELRALMEEQKKAEAVVEAAKKKVIEARKSEARTVQKASQSGLVIKTISEATAEGSPPASQADAGSISPTTPTSSALVAADAAIPVGSAPLPESTGPTTPPDVAGGDAHAVTPAVTSVIAVSNVATPSAISADAMPNSPPHGSTSNTAAIPNVASPSASVSSPPGAQSSVPSVLSPQKTTSVGEYVVYSNESTMPDSEVR